MSTINGLPAHVLLVHAILVLLPLAAVLLVVTAVSPAMRRRLAGPNALLSLAVLALVPVTTDAVGPERRVPRLRCCTTTRSLATPRSGWPCPWRPSR
ncbi:hypothetical protein KRM28CT15_44410 [Krasilnikovia sp. M28-CT-15]